ncbi:unnamed protein product [Alopecurus aequalis]
MPLAGNSPSSALLLPLLLVLWAEAQPVKGLMPNSGYCELLAGNATATGAAEMCMCYQGSAFDGEARLVDKDPGTVLLNAAGAAPSPAPWRAPSPTPERQRAPPPLLPGAAPAHGKCLSWPAKAWVLLVLTVTMLIIVFLSRPETLPVSRIDGNGDSQRDGYSDGDFFYCAICMETVSDIVKFSIGSCGHEFCFSCVAQYVAAKLGENLARVECPDPGCRGVGAVEPESCIGIISPDLLDKWGFLLCESAFGAGKVYCPYRECSAPLLIDGEEGIAEAECPHCHRLFCARCAVP